MSLSWGIALAKPNGLLYISIGAAARKHYNNTC